MTVGSLVHNASTESGHWARPEKSNTCVRLFHLPAHHTQKPHSHRSDLEHSESGTDVGVRYKHYRPITRSAEWRGCLQSIGLRTSNKHAVYRSCLRSSWRHHSPRKQVGKCVVLNVHRNHKAYWGRGERRGGGGMEVGEGRGRLYTYRYTVTTRMIPALRWAAMRAILMFQ